jgi:DNA helicase-2/ATP-dependent DNA helicase PcrA
MSRKRNYIEGLNPEQRAAVEHFEGPLLVLAGAGSGKTRVLTTRIAHLVEEHGVDPAAILAVTFTNKAAGEMRERIRQLLGHDPAGSWVGTFHAIGARLLRRHAHLLGEARDRGGAPAPAPGWSPSFSIYDGDAALREVKRILERLNLSAKEWHPRSIQVAISGAKNRFVDPATFAELARDPFSRVVADVYPAYQRALRDQNALDFDDLLVKPVELFRTYPTLLAEYRARFPFILVDEYQDTNHVQYRFIKLLALGYDEAPAAGAPGGAAFAGPANLMVVGDDDQSIYGWRGADIRNILDFEKDFPDAATIRLERNYRSTARILEAANLVIAENARRKGKTLRTDSGPGELLTEIAAASEEDEAEWIVTEILARLEEDPQRTARDFVVLYRTNAQSRALEEAFLRRGLAYQIIGGTRFYERREIMDLLAYLRLISNPRDGGAFDRVVNYPRRGIGDTTRTRLLAWAAEQGISALDAAAAADRCEGVTRGAAAALVAFAALIERYRALAAQLGVGELVEKLAAEIGIFDALTAEGPEGEDRIANVEELIAGAYVFDAGELELDDETLTPETTALDLYLQQVSLVADVDRHDAGAHQVTMMTLHNAKGLEFPFVFISGLEEGLFPLSRAYEEPDALEEERRLFYVGITRAREKLYLIHARSRRRLGTIQDSMPSSFLAPIPDELLERRSTSRLMRAGGGRERWRSSWPVGSAAGRAQSARAEGAGEESGGLVVDYSDGQDLPRFIKGEIVRHAQFGRGTIRELSGFGLDLKAVIEFESVGRKKVVVRYANLQKEL